MKTTTSPRRRRQARPRTQIAAAVGTARGGGAAKTKAIGEELHAAVGTAGGGNTAAGARGYGIRAGETGYGSRSEWGPVEYAQAAITALYPRGIPRGVNCSRLTDDVNERLVCDPGFNRKTSRQTVMRALRKLRAASRLVGGN